MRPAREVQKALLIVEWIIPHVNLTWRAVDRREKPCNVTITLNCHVRRHYGVFEVGIGAEIVQKGVLLTS